MTNSVNPIPEGYTSLTPFLVVDGASRAIDFYCDAFGATVVERMDGPDGTVMHAELDFDYGRLQLSDPHLGIGLHAPSGTNDVDHSYVLYCADADAVFARAVASVPGCSRNRRPSSPATGSRRSSIRSVIGGP